MTFDYSLAALVTAGCSSISPTLCCGPSGSERTSMTINGWIQILIYCALVTALVKPLGWYMTRVFNGERTFLSPVLRPVERGALLARGVDEKREQHWTTYAIAMLLFNAAGFLLLYALQRLQHCPAVQSGRACRRWRRTLASTPPSASPPTPTGRPTPARAR